MLSRYTIYRRRPKDAPSLPDGIRQDSRWRTRHILRPTQELVENYLANLTDDGWQRFKREYLELLNVRRIEQRKLFDDFAALATDNDVFIGCSCPTAKQRDIEHCHTWLALQFLQTHYPSLSVSLNTHKQINRKENR